ncbi:MAG: DUF86 domain-containing protein [Rhodothermales bacterium]
MSRPDTVYLRHILDEAIYLASASDGLDQSTFLTDPTLRRAFARSTEIMGEATKQLSADLRDRYTDVEWRSMARMRNRLIHGYIGVDYEVVWNVAAVEAPLLRDRLEAIIAEEEAR